VINITTNPSAIIYLCHAIQEIMSQHKKPNYLLSLLKLKCPRCREGDMFHSKSSYTKGFTKMHESCEVCGQPMEPEVAFYYGTGYVSYALAVAISVSTFIAWWVLIGFSLNDSRFFWWIGVNAFILIVSQPYLMRLSRTIWLSFFVKYQGKGVVKADL
jgi:uncharacterized protein (DUF983 family)